MTSKKEADMVDHRHIVYLLSFLFTLSLTPAIYINSSFLEQFVGSKNVGYIYTVGSILTLIAFILIRKALRKYGNYKVFLNTLLIITLSYVFLSLSLVLNTNLVTSSLFVIVYILVFLCHGITFFNLDIFLEHLTTDEDTGGIRGFFLTAMNLAFIIGPLIAGLMISTVADAGKVYALGAIIMLPVIVITHKYFKNFKDPKYEKGDTWHTAKKVHKNKNLYKIFVSGFILRLFYSWMVIYTPIFLHSIIGFSLGTITTIIGFSLIPFVILQVPLGKIADTKYGEKEILTVGFIITALATIVMSFVSIQSVIVWIIILFMTRVGASMIEIMTETYLFKKIDDDDINIMSLYRAVRPVAYITGPIIASLLLFFINVQYMFVVFGVIVLFGIKYSLTLKDTK